MISDSEPLLNYPFNREKKKIYYWIIDDEIPHIHANTTQMTVHYG